MGVLLNPLFFLPIHSCSYEAYYQAYDEWVKPRKRELENQYGKPFDQLDHRIKLQWGEMWFWPPWKFNDIVGYLDIGMDGGDCLTADIYLKRKYFPKSARERQYHRHHTTLKNHEFLYYWEIGKVKVNVEDNDSYLLALKEILDEANRIIKKRNRNFQLWLPPFDFNCFNFIEAYEQVKKKG